MGTGIQYTSSRSVMYSCKYHVVWCPKYRRPVLLAAVAKRLKQIIRDVASEHEADVIELEVMPDHVHGLMEVHPQFGIHRLIKAMKGRSSRVLRDEFPWLKSRLPTLWTRSYFVSTVGGAPLRVIKQYIEHQSGV
jgi:putative transposase